MIGRARDGRQVDAARTGVPGVLHAGPSSARVDVDHQIILEDAVSRHIVARTPERGRRRDGPREVAVRSTTAMPGPYRNAVKRS